MNIQKDLLKEIANLLKSENTIAVTDKTVYSLYKSLFGQKTIVLPPSEKTKKLATIEKIAKELVKFGALRNAKIVAVGGGVVGDVTGFIASVFMRGVDWVSVPTTLLAMCDSGIGGKTGVDLDGYKNIIGSFHMPKDILISINFIKTLNEREFLCGIGEALKTACLDETIFKFFIDNKQSILDKCESTLFELVSLCANFKKSIVEKDPFEKSGLRKILNYGHTIGHGLEAADNAKKSHGEYILYGMKYESLIFKDEIDPKYHLSLNETIDNLLSGQKLAFCKDKVFSAIKTDKKNLLGKISTIIVTKPGETKEMLLEKSEFRKRLEWI